MELRKKALEEFKRKIVAPPSEAEFVGVRAPKPPKEVPAPEIKNVGELKDLLRKYREHLEKRGYAISAYIVETMFKELERVPNSVSAIPSEVLRNVQVHVVAAATIYRVLGSEGMYWKLLAVARRLVRGDMGALEKLRERLKNLFPISEEVYPGASEKVRESIEEIVEALTKPHEIPSLVAKKNIYYYMESMSKNERKYLRIAGDIEEVQRREIIPIHHTAKIAGKLSPEIWRKIVENIPNQKFSGE